MSTENQTTESTDSHRPEPVKKSKTKRCLLLTLGPLLVAVVSLYFYWTGGRYVTTDNAYVQADKTAVSPEVSGTILDVLVDENDFVEKGTPLLKIDPRSYLIALEQSKAELQSTVVEVNKLKAAYQQKLNELKLAQSDIDFSRKEYKRQSALDSKHAVAKTQFDDALHSFQVSSHRQEIIQSQKAQILAQLEGNPDIEPTQLSGYRLALAKVDKAALDLEKTTVLAPFSGRVSKLPKEGKHIQPGTLAMSLIADKNFWIEANLKETELTNILPGQTVAIEIDTYPDVEFTGSVQSVSPGTGSEFSVLPAQNATGNWVKVVQRIPVRVQIDEPEGQQILRSGMSTTVKIDTEFHRLLPFWITMILDKFGIANAAVASQEGNE